MSLVKKLNKGFATRELTIEDINNSLLRAFSLVKDDFLKDISQKIGIACEKSGIKFLNQDFEVGYNKKGLWSARLGKEGITFIEIIYLNRKFEIAYK